MDADTMAFDPLDSINIRHGIPVDMYLCNRLFLLEGEQSHRPIFNWLLANSKPVVAVVSGIWSDEDSGTTQNIYHFRVWEITQEMAKDILMYLSTLGKTQTHAHLTHQQVIEYIDGLPYWEHDGHVFIMK